MTGRSPRKDLPAISHLLPALVLLLTAADWPHVRGPAFDAHSAETGLATSWPAAGPPVLWVRDLGPGYSAVVVADGRAITLYQTAGGIYLTALDAGTGAELWRERVDWPWQPGGLYPGPYAAPTIHAGRVYYATPAGTVGCVDAATGGAVWAVDVRKRFAGRGVEFGFASAPLVDNGRVILPVGGPGASVVALSAADGSTLWASGDDPASYCPALPVTLDGRRLVVGFLRNSVVLHDPATGQRVWRERLSDSYDEHAAWPLFDGRHLLLASPFRVGARVTRLTATGDGVTATPVWAGRQLSNDVSSSVLHAGAVYGFDLQQSQASTHRPSRGMFKCLDLVTGAVRWETDRVGQASAVVVDGHLVLWTETGEAVLAMETPERYEELARATVLGGNGLCWAAPAFADRRLFVRDRRQIACVHLGPPADLLPGQAAGAVVMAGTGFDWTRLLPTEPEYPNDAPTAGELGRWFAACLGVFALAGGLTGLTRRRLFWPVAFLLGAAGTTAAGAWAGVFVLTWPAALYAAFRAVVAAGTGAAGWRRQVLARAGLLLFVGLCYGYYRLCPAVGYAMAWGFLAGFAPAAPPAVLAAHSTGRRRWAWDAAGFAVYFWASGMLPGLKDQMG